MKHIDQETYKVVKECYYKSKHVKTQIIIGSSLRKDNNNSTHLKHKNRGKHKHWSCYTVGRDGSIFEHYDPLYYSDFMGKKAVDKISISVILENMGGLVKVGDNKYINWLNEECDSKNVGKKKWMLNTYWELYPTNQMKGLAELCKFLCEKFDIRLNCFEIHHHHEQANEYKGILFRSNYDVNGNDLNPFFNIDNFNELLTS